MSRFYFARMQDDGRLGAPINPGYTTRALAEADATKLLRLRGSAKIVLIEVIDNIEVVAKIKFQPFGGKP
jgi:hypothetical protein